MAKQPLLLCVLDGWGYNPHSYANAIRTGQTPVWDELIATYPHTLLRCQGESVGLREGLMGNSEVGHENLGAGRTVLQEILFIDKAIDDGSFFEKPAFVAAVERVKQSGGNLHLMGLTSDGGVHSSEKHYLALIDLGARAGLRPDQILFHAIMDGRDTDPRSGAGFVQVVQDHMDRTGYGRLATVLGRYWAMDRDKRWPRTRLAYDALVHGRNTQDSGDLADIEFGVFPTAAAAIADAYATGDSREYDEFMKPRLIAGPDGAPLPRFRDGDALIFFNFRGDRPRQILYPLHRPEFAEFPTGVVPDMTLASVTQYEAALTIPYGFKRERPVNILGEVVSAAGLTQLRAAETEKYAHVTFFFNNQFEQPYPGEERILVKSPPVATYDLQPEMSAFRLAGAVVDNIERFDVAVVNFANPDMVGHTGVFEAAVKAVEAVDKCLGLLLARVRELGGRAIITADHGNCEEMIAYDQVRDAAGKFDYALRIPHTQHTTYNLTPCVLVDDAHRGAELRAGGCLGDIAPTMLQLLGLPQPVEMTGESLLPE
ncbi:MAG TPA: 2,3-bisphosphoglycerate-independent phosphoglycerate mutase [Armatimonadetes bacterium]|nr:2,3-bisphosphoglycerate-independent phosphoglycerate mutase [Armatimonadota bacterium]